AARAAAMIAPEVAIPIHWGTFAPVWRGGRLSDPARPAREFARLTSRYAPSVEVRVLAPGRRTELLQGVTRALVQPHRVMHTSLSRRACVATCQRVTSQRRKRPLIAV